MLNRRKFLRQSMLFTGALFSTCSAKALFANTERKRPNIVFILADDISAEDIGCYGNPGAHTPNMDALADGGIRFNNGFVTIASCSPSRGSIMLGRWPHATGMAELHTQWRPDKEECKAFVEKLDFMSKNLQDAGYYTIQSGKWHIGGLYKWDRPDGIFKNYFDSADIVNLGNDGGAYRWVELLRNRPKDKPFFCWYSTFDAHIPFTAPNIHQREDVHVPPYVPDVNTGPVNTRQYLASYYDEITRLDSYVGKVVKELKAQGVYENTLIVILADNGRPMVRAKVFIHDSGVRVPFIVHWPNGIAKPGSVSESLVSSIDLAPTFAELAGGDIGNTTFQGKSFVSLLAGNPNDLHHRYIFTERNHHMAEAHERGVRDNQFLYIRNRRPLIQRRGSGWQGGACMFILRQQLNGKPMPREYAWFFEECPEEELFDAKKDPDMMKNLALSPKYAGVLKKMRKVLADWERQTGDTAPENLTKNFWDADQMKRPFCQLPPSPELIGEQPGWSYWQKKTAEEIRAEAAVTRGSF